MGLVKLFKIVSELVL